MRKFKVYLSLFVCAMLLMTNIPVVHAIESAKPILVVTSPKEKNIYAENSIVLEGFTIDAETVNVLVDGELVGSAEEHTLLDLDDEYIEYSDKVKNGFIYEVENLSSGQKTIIVEATSSNGEKVTEAITVNKVNSQKDEDEKVHLNYKSNLVPIVNIDNVKNNQYYGVADLHIGGWAINKSGVKQVNILVDGKVVGQASLGFKREDVNKIYPNYKDSLNSGYNFTIPIKELRGKDRQITVQAIGNDGTTQSSLIKVLNRPSQMSLDVPSSNSFHTNSDIKVGGWALSGQGIKEVNILIDGKLIGQAELGFKRDDVNKAYPGYPNGVNSGYNFTIPIKELQGKNRALTVEAVSNDGTKQRKTATINKKPSQMSIDTPVQNATFNGDLKIGGWSLNSSGVRKVEVEVDGVLVGEASLGFKRDDVNKAYPGYPNGANSGYNFTIPYSKVQNANRKITVRAVGSDGTTMAKTIDVKYQGAIKSAGAGHVDRPSQNQSIDGSTVEIAGWAVHSKGVKEVRVLINDKQVATTKPTSKREDVGKIYPAYPGSTNSGFSVSVSKNLIPQGNNIVKFEIVGEDNTVFTATRNFIMNKLVSRLSVDSPADRTTYPVGQDVVVGGWALNDSSVERVEVSLDGKVIGNATLGASRPDVNSAYPGYPSGNNSGYNFLIKANQLTKDAHTITVKAIGKDGEVTTVTKILYYGVTFKKTIVIDPGHNNGGDEGAIQNGYYERVLNMEVADKLRNKLVAAGYEVIMTRDVGEIQTEGLQASLQRRVRIANEAKADLFISLHHNSAGSVTSAKGVEVWYSSARNNTNIPGIAQAAANSAALSKQVVNSLANLGYTNRGAKDGNLYVTKNTNMTSILIELGFLSNKAEADKCANSAEQDRKATAITDVVKQFLK